MERDNRDSRAFLRGYLAQNRENGFGGASRRYVRRSPFRPKQKADLAVSKRERDYRDSRALLRGYLDQNREGGFGGASAAECGAAS